MMTKLKLSLSSAEKKKTSKMLNRKLNLRSRGLKTRRIRRRLSKILLVVNPLQMI